ncbi:protein POLYCHOME-like [Euphorbia lathyris]|uniref:protein POLYCHOME-like n=1 Tax=Euphorbia lathyris TaxID=212925 RepID=UPI0033137AF9
MAESRDRLSRPIDIASLYARSRFGTPGIYQDQPDLERLLNPPIRRPIATSPVVPRRGGLGTPRVQAGTGRNMFRTPATDRENMPIGSASRGTRNGRGRASNRVLPYRYPRTPLRDITAIVRAYERRRKLVGGSRAQEIESPTPHTYRVGNSSESSSPGAHFEHSNMKTPAPRTALKRCPTTVGKVSKILLAVTNKASGDSEFLTPQKKLLNSIDTVEKEVMQELQKLQRTSSAKRAEREKKVRTLMSLR